MYANRFFFTSVFEVFPLSFFAFVFQGLDSWIDSSPWSLSSVSFLFGNGSSLAYVGENG
jgi:hypothetical protein